MLFYTKNNWTSFILLDWSNGTLPMFNLATCQFLSCFSMQFTLQAWQDLHFDICVKHLITPWNLLGFAPKFAQMLALGPPRLAPIFSWIGIRVCEQWFNRNFYKNFQIWCHLNRHHGAKNRDFVAPVSILTPFVCALFSWASQYTTVCLDKLNIVHYT